MNEETISSENSLNTTMLNSSYYYGTRVDNISRSFALNTIRKCLTDNCSGKPVKVYFTNVHTIHLAHKIPGFAEIINRADLVLPDGSGLKIAGKLFSKPVKANLNGTDFIPCFFKNHQGADLKIYLLGTRENILIKCVNNVREKYPGLNVVGYHSGYYDKQDEHLIVEDILKSSPDILLVATGSPRQEMFIDKYADMLNVPVSFAVGGLFDFLSGEMKRAPQWLRDAGFEWIYRFFQDPVTKWERVMVEIPIFLFRILLSRIFSANDYSS